MNNIEKIPVHYHGVEYECTEEEYQEYRSYCTNQVESILKPMIETFLSGGVACEGDDYPMDLDDIIRKAERIERAAINNLLHDRLEVFMSEIEGYEEYGEDDDTEDTIKELAELVGIRYINADSHHFGEVVSVTGARAMNLDIEVEALKEAADFLSDHGFI